MAQDLGGAELQLRTDSSAFDRGLNEAHSSAQGIFGKLAKAASIAGVAMAAAFAGAKVAGFIKESIGAASDLGEAISKNNVLFKGSAAGVVAWSQTTSASMGISQNSALAATGTFGNLFTAMGIAPAASAKFSQGLVQNAADMASFNNASPEEVLEAIRAGLVGET